MNGTILVECNPCRGLFSKMIGAELLEWFTTNNDNGNVNDNDNDNDSILLSFVNPGAVMPETHFNFRSTSSSSKNLLKFAPQVFKQQTLECP